MKEAYLGMGTNIGDREKNLRAAIDALTHLPKTQVEAISSVYETAPVGYLDQADFLNLCVRIQTGLSPHALLGACLGIEAAMGRERPFKNAPRVLDIDLLLYEGVQLATEELTLPHARMGERAFVLAPLAEIITGSAIAYSPAKRLAQITDQQITRTDIKI